MVLITSKQKLRIQDAMFRSIYKHNEDLPNEERFIKAIVYSCDEEIDKAIKEKSDTLLEYLRYLDECEAYKINDEMDKRKRGLKWHGTKKMT